MGTSTDLTLFISFILLVLLSGFFSSSETGMLSLNRYRLRHRAKHGFKPGKRVFRMLKRPDRLLGIILIGNTFANVLASSVATVLAVRWFGDLGVPIATLAVTLILLIFSEITPKTFAALHPEWIAYPFSLPLLILQKVLYPVVWLGNAVANGVLRCMRVNVGGDRTVEPLTLEELRTVLNEASGKLPSRHRRMLVSILDLANGTVEDIMVPRNNIQGLNMEEDWATMMETLASTEHTWLPVYNGSLDNVQGMLHVRSALKHFARQKVDKPALVKAAEDVYFIPENTPLDVQLFNFQKRKCRIGLVIDEYGDIEGLATLEDIFEEIVGEFTTDWASTGMEITPDPKGRGYIIEGRVSVRDINRALDTGLPTDGPRTFSGLIIEYLEELPDTPVCLTINRCGIEIIQTKARRVAKARLILPDDHYNKNTE